MIRLWSNHNLSSRLFGRVQVIWNVQKNHNFGPFYTILAILDDFGQALLFKKTNSFEIPAESLVFKIFKFEFWRLIEKVDLPQINLVQSLGYLYASLLKF